ncbi:prepilin-type N-terminal cleavage/methylation domain-containing protein [Candidatus Babeliales bacterium]|nr:prepilin-type N-terminal cleavage/methylation domain-containing protein [Candidatus Babeliales bacterium]
MRKEKAFTLLEVLIAISISTFIIFAMTQVYRNVVRYISKNRELMSLNRKVCLLVDQMEKDLTCAFIPKLSKNGPVKKNQKSGKEVVKKEKKKKEKISFFKVEIYEDETRRVKGKRWELFKNINFITTNPLLVFEQNCQRFIRVSYKLIKDKETSTREKVSYNLFRKETLNLENEEFLVFEEGVKKEKEDLIHTYLVAKNIKDFYLQCVELKIKSDESQSEKVEYEQVRTFVWKDEEEKESSKKEKEKKRKSCIVPQKVEIVVNFWDEELRYEHSFECSIPIFSYLVEKNVAESKKK